MRHPLLFRCYKGCGFSLGVNDASFADEVCGSGYAGREYGNVCSAAGGVD
jgi:hypothetical protein